MKAARLYGAGDLRVGTEPAPEPGPGEQLVRVSDVGICGSDLHWFSEGAIGATGLSKPLVLGHEMAGVLLSGPHAGAPVAIDPAVPCERCERCREGNRHLCPEVVFAGHGATDGGLREQMAWPDAQLVAVPEALTPAATAMLEPLGVALHALDLGYRHFAETVAIVGCGPIGLLLVALARAAGSSRVVAVEPLAHRREAAEHFGADEVLSPQEAMGRVEEVDVVYEVAGNDAALAEAVHLVRPAGRLVVVGIPDDDTSTLPASQARRKGLSVYVSRRMNEAYPRAITVARRGVLALDEFVSHTFPIDRAEEAFAVAVRREGLKVVVTM